MKLGTESGVGCNQSTPAEERLSTKVCRSLGGKRLRGREEMLNINMDHGSGDVVTDAPQFLLVRKGGRSHEACKKQENMT